MELLNRICSDRDWVIDLGGHVGYVALHLASLVGREGRVTVFEPGPNNLPYIENNISGHPQIQLVPSAVADHTGTVELYIENLTGQNNSIIGNYQTFINNRRRAGAKNIPAVPVSVPCTSLDQYVVRSASHPTFIKIDVEGAELQVLHGMKTLLSHSGTVLLIEVTENIEAVFSILEGAGFRLFTPDRRPVNATRSCRGSFFCVKPSDERSGLFTHR